MVSLDVQDALRKKGEWPEEFENRSFQDLAEDPKYLRFLSNASRYRFLHRTRDPPAGTKFSYESVWNDLDINVLVWWQHPRQRPFMASVPPSLERMHMEPGDNLKKKFVVNSEHQLCIGLMPEEYHDDMVICQCMPCRAPEHDEQTAVYKISEVAMNPNKTNPMDPNVHCASNFVHIPGQPETHIEHDEGYVPYLTDEPVPVFTPPKSPTEAGADYPDGADHMYREWPRTNAYVDKWNLAPGQVPRLFALQPRNSIVAYFSSILFALALFLIAFISVKHFCSFQKPRKQSQEKLLER